MKVAIILVVVSLIYSNCKSIGHRKKHAKTKKLYDLNGHTRDSIIGNRTSNATIDKRFFGKQLGFSYDKDKESRENRPTVLKNQDEGEEHEEYEGKKGVHTGYKDEEDWGDDHVRQDHKPKIDDDLMHHDDSKGDKLFGGGHVDHDEHTKNSNNLMNKLGFTFHGGRVHMDEDGHLAQGDAESEGNSLVGGRGGQYHRDDEEEDEDEDEHDRDHEKEDIEKSSSKHRASAVDEDEEDDEASSNHHIGPFPFAPLPQGYHKGRGPKNEADDDEEDRIKDEKEEAEEREEEALSNKEKEEENEDLDDHDGDYHHKENPHRKFSEADQNPYHHQEHVSIRGDDNLRDKEKVGLPMHSFHSKHRKENPQEESDHEKNAHNIVFVLDGKQSLQEIQGMKGLNDVIKTLASKAIEDKNETKTEDKPASGASTDKTPAETKPAETNATVATNAESKQNETRPSETNVPVQVNTTTETTKTNVTIAATQLIPNIATPENSLLLKKENQQAGVFSKDAASDLVAPMTGSAVKSSDTKPNIEEEHKLFGQSDSVNKIQSPFDAKYASEKHLLNNQHEIISPGSETSELTKSHSSEISSPTISSHSQDSILKQESVQLKPSEALIHEELLSLKQEPSNLKQLESKEEPSTTLLQFPTTQLHHETMSLKEPLQSDSNQVKFELAKQELLAKQVALAKQEAIFREEEMSKQEALAAKTEAAAMKEPAEEHHRLSSHLQQELERNEKPSSLSFESARQSPHEVGSEVNIKMQKLHHAESEGIASTSKAIGAEYMQGERLSKERMSQTEPLSLSNAQQDLKSKATMNEALYIKLPVDDPDDHRHSVSLTSQMKDSEQEMHVKPHPSRFSDLAEAPEPSTTTNRVEFKEPTFQRLTGPEETKKHPAERPLLIAPDLDADAEEHAKHVTRFQHVLEENKALVKKAGDETEISFSKVHPDTSSPVGADSHGPILETTRAIMKDQTKFSLDAPSEHSRFYNAENLSKEDLSSRTSSYQKSPESVKDNKAQVLHCQKCETNPGEARNNLEGSKNNNYDLVFQKMNKGSKKGQIPPPLRKKTKRRNIKRAKKRGKKRS